MRELIRVYSEAVQSAIGQLSDDDVIRSIAAAGYTDILEAFNLEVPAEETPTEEPTPVPTEIPRTTRHGGWFDEVVISVVDAAAAVTAWLTHANPEIVQRAALLAGENGAVDLAAHGSVLGDDAGAARTA